MVMRSAACRWYWCLTAGGKGVKWVSVPKFRVLRDRQLDHVPRQGAGGVWRHKATSLAIGEIRQFSWCHFRQGANQGQLRHG